MPVTGRKPKPEGQKRNRVKPTHDWVEVIDVPFTGAPKLPRQRPNGKPWPKWTREWWAVVSAQPHCILWKDADWRFALDTAVVAAEFHEGDMRQAPAFLAREKILGTTLDFRRDLRIRYVEPATETPDDGSVTAIDEYRAMVGA